MSNSYTHYILLHRRRVIMPKQLTVSSRSISIPEHALRTPYGYWFPLNLLCLDLYGIVNQYKLTSGMLPRIDGILITTDGHVYSIQYSDGSLDCWPIMWDDDSGFYLINNRRGMEDAVHALHEIEPDMDPHKMLDMASEIVLANAGDRFDFNIDDLVDEMKKDEKTLSVDILFREISSMNTRMNSANNQTNCRHQPNRMPQ